VKVEPNVQNRDTISIARVHPTGKGKDVNKSGVVHVNQILAKMEALVKRACKLMDTFAYAVQDSSEPSVKLCLMHANQILV